MSDSRGFTLLETLVAVVVLAVGAMAIASGMAVTVSAGTHAGEQTRAVALASQKLEEMRTRAPSQVRSEGPVAVDALGDEGSGPYRREVVVVDDGAGAKTKEVTVRVDYRTGLGGTRTVELYTILYTGS